MAITDPAMRAVYEAEIETLTAKVEAIGALALELSRQAEAVLKAEGFNSPREYALSMAIGGLHNEGVRLNLEIAEALKELSDDPDDPGVD